MNAVFGKIGDIDSWLSLVKEVRGNFPGLETESALEEHRRAVLEFMSEDRALCVKSGEDVIGVLLFSVKHNMICCLAVSPSYRRRGIAAALMTKALERLDHSRDITVTTFRADDPKGAAPRALYKKFGFEEDEPLTEFGYPVQRFVLRSDRCKPRFQAV